MNTFVQRLINVSFTLHTGALDAGGTQTVPLFKESGTNTAALSGLRTSAKIVNSGGFELESLELRIFGMSQSLMNQLSTYSIYPLTNQNSVTVLAGDTDTTPELVFSGAINAGFADYSGMPETSFVIQANAGQFAAVKTIDSSSYAGPVDVATALATLAKQAHLKFENNGVQVQIPKSTLTGSAIDQMRAIVDAAGIGATISRGTLAIWPANGARSGTPVLISVENGMAGFPSFWSGGVIVKKLYDSNIKQGGQVQVQSSLTPACGVWNVFKVDHDLEAMTPNGQWFSTISLTRFGLAGFGK